MTELFMDALIDTAKMIPLLLIIYIGIEFVELRVGGKIKETVVKTGRAGPLIGTAFGCIPQCGFSVISSALYTKGLITLGTLMAVFISTSDEAIPIILSQPKKLYYLLPIILIKIVIALIAGYMIELVVSKKKEKKTVDEEEIQQVQSKACCGHEYSEKNKVNLKELFFHPLVHTAKVFLFIFVTTLLLNYLIFLVGEQNLNIVLLGGSFLQPIITALFGLIPNCAASVVITQLFLQDGLSFGAVIAGLTSSAGLGLLVLVKENKNIKDTVKIIALLFGISATAGIIIQIIMQLFGMK